MSTVAPGSYWGLLERDNTPTKRRAAHAKARTGCVTCKTRRVKCDEKKPSCARCEKAAYTCGGYEDPNAKQRRSGGAPPFCRKAVEPLSLRPKPLQRRIVRVATEVEEEKEGEGRPLNLTRASLTPTYLDPCDVPYFDRFRCQIVTDISVWCGAEYWTYIMREFMHDECLKHATLALAATLQAIELAPDASSGPLAQSVHSKMAIRHYQKSIALCRTKLNNGMTAATARSGLTATFFFALIEVLQGNIGDADQMLGNGMMLLVDATRRRGADGRPVVEMTDELVGIQMGFDRLTITWGLCPFTSNRDREEIYAIITPTQQFILPDKDAPFSLVQALWNMFQKDLGLFLVTVRCGTIITPEHAATVLFQQSKYLAQLGQWMPLIEHYLEREKDSIAIYTVSSMKACALCYTIFLDTFLDRSELSYDLHLDHFKEIVKTCQKFVPEKPPLHMKFTLDVDLFPVISFTVTKCRDQKTRLHALKVFSEMTHRQAMWTNRGMMRALRVHVDMEHRGRDSNGYIPASARYAFVDSRWDYEQSQMMARFICATSVPTESGDLPTVRVPIAC